MVCTDANLYFRIFWHSLINPKESSDVVDDYHKFEPRVPVGVSGTALAASLLRDGWSVSTLVFIVGTCFFLHF